MIRIYRYSTILAIAGSLALAACSTEEPQSQMRPADGRIYLQFQADGSAETANDGRSSDVESRVETADVFIYDGEQCLYYERLSIPENAAPVPLSEAVATDFVMGQQYEVRVVANYRDGEDGNEPFPADEASWPSRSALSEMVAVTSQLVNTTEATVTPLLMEGATDAQLNDGTGNLVDVSVPLTRAAVKIAVEVSIGDPVRTEDSAEDNPGGYIETSYAFYGGTLGRLHNAADRVRMVAGSELSLAELDGHLVTTEKWNSYEVVGDDHSTLSFYCYPSDWSGAHTIEQETFVNVDIPVSSARSVIRRTDSRWAKHPSSRRRTTTIRCSSTTGRTRRRTTSCCATTSTAFAPNCARWARRRPKYPLNSTRSVRSRFSTGRKSPSTSIPTRRAFSCSSARRS